MIDGLTREDMVEWRRIDEAPSYEVSSLGQVRRALPGLSGAAIVGRIMRQHKDKDGYLFVILFHQGRRIKRLVAALVLMAFVGPRPAGYVAAHGPLGKAVNTQRNLRWATQADNIADRDAAGTTARGERAGAAKLTDGAVREIRHLFTGKRGDLSRLAACYGVSRPAIRNIIDRKVWAHV